MRRSPIVAGLLLALAGCTDAPPPVALSDQGVRASFLPGSEIYTIRIDATDRLPLRAAELVAPDGSTTQAGAIDVVKNPTTRTGPSAVQGAWSNPTFTSATGTGLLGSGGQLASSLPSQSTVLEMVSRADIQLPDPVAYRRDWANYRIRVSFDAGGGTLDTREIPAPAPPAPPQR